MMETAGPIHSDIALLSIQPGRSLHASACTDATEFEKAIEDGAIIPDVEPTLLSCVVLHIVWGDFLQKIHILVCVKLGHFMIRGRFGALGLCQ